MNLTFDLTSIFRGVLGVISLLAVAYLLSTDRKSINWNTIARGFGLLLFLVIAMLCVPWIGSGVEFIGRGVVKLMEFTDAGVGFLLGQYADRTNGFCFLFHAMPIVIFFSVLVSIFYHWGVIQKCVQFMSWIVRKIIPISGAEGMVACSNSFLSMTESPLLIRPYLSKMTDSEFFVVMVAGMATISGSVMGTYITMLASDDPMAKVLFAKQFITVSILAIPGSLIFARIICPQTKPSVCGEITFEKDKNDTLLDVISRGTTMGVKLVVNISAMLLVFIALIALLNYITNDIFGNLIGVNGWIRDFTGGKVEGLTIQFILGMIVSPFMWLLGIPSDDIMLVGSLVGQKLIMNEFVAYLQLQEWREAGFFVYEKSELMSTYILCGFANISSIGILVGGFGVLAPNKMPLISKYGLRAMAAGAMVSMLSATLFGMML